MSDRAGMPASYDEDISREPAAINATVTLTDDEQFFYEHAGYSARKGETTAHAKARWAIVLADAEHNAQFNGWKVSWEIDPEADTTPTCSYFVSGNPQWIATLYDEGEVLASLGGIDFAEAYEITPEDDPYARVVAAELALEAL